MAEGFIRVFHLIDSLKQGGSETQAVEVACRMDPDRYEVTLGCLRAEGPLLDLLRQRNIRVEEFYPSGGVDSPGGIYQLLRLAKFLRQGRFDVVHAHDLWSNLIGVPAAKLARVPVIIASQRDLGHQAWYGTGRRRWYRRVQNLADVVLTNANCIRDALIMEGRLSPAKITVIHNGVDVERFSRTNNKCEPLTRSAGRKFIALVANMHSEVKGHRTLIAAAPRVIQKCPSARFVLVGDGPLRGKFEGAVSELRLKDNFVFLGRRDDVQNVLQECDLGVLPSVSEGLPNALLEYMCAGLAVVASDVGGNTELIKNQERGLLVPAGDPEALANALLELLEDSARSSRMGEENRQFVTANFSFERLIREVDALYREMLRNKN